jgi:hypothetical protein
MRESCSWLPGNALCDAQLWDALCLMCITHTSRTSIVVLWSADSVVQVRRPTAGHTLFSMLPEASLYLQLLPHESYTRPLSLAYHVLRISPLPCHEAGRHNHDVCLAVQCARYTSRVPAAELHSRKATSWATSWHWEYVKTMVLT